MEFNSNEKSIVSAHFIRISSKFKFKTYLLVELNTKIFLYFVSVIND